MKDRVLCLSTTCSKYTPLRFASQAKFVRAADHFARPEQAATIKSSSQDFHLYVIYSDILEDVCAPSNFAALLFLKF
jgi:hypothetical protein